jgi:hypothetical protein
MCSFNAVHQPIPQLGYVNSRFKIQNSKFKLASSDVFCVAVVKPSRGVAFGQRLAGSVKDFLPNAKPLHAGNTN